ncbi:MAG: Nre family DNA repair protein [Candidatus Korarchaeota archaeon]|nr:Nre family DNA repair protein [Candidatus Korarchaeota archaeon]
MPSRIDPSLCVRCKGTKLLCGLSKCPILERVKSQAKVPKTNLVEGPSPPSALVGERGYPRVSVGPMVALREPDLPERPALWIRRSLSYMISRFSSQVYAHFIMDVRRVDEPQVEEVRWALLSEVPVEMEAKLKRPPTPRISFDGLLTPLGPTAPVERVKLAEEPKIPTPIERSVYDRDLSAAEGIVELYGKGVDVYSISKVLSLGSLGIRGRRRLVPTRWAITAVDSMVGNWLRRLVEQMPPYAGDILLFRSSYEGNRYFVLIVPGPYILEIVEAWLPRGLWTRSSREAHVLINGEHTRTGLDYMDGGHYAMRIAVLEKLRSMRRQASVLAIREIGPEYYAPVGVWQVREGMRMALSSEPARFGELDEALRFLRGKVRFDLTPILRSSRLLRFVKRWTSLEGFLE